MGEHNNFNNCPIMQLPWASLYELVGFHQLWEMTRCMLHKSEPSNQTLLVIKALDVIANLFKRFLLLFTDCEFNSIRYFVLARELKFISHGLTGLFYSVFFSFILVYFSESNASNLKALKRVILRYNTIQS